MIFKMWVKSEFDLWQPGYYNLLIEKKGEENLHFWSTYLFENVLLPPISRNSVQVTSINHILMGNFTLWNSIFF